MRRLAAAGVALLLTGACTQSFDQFSVGSGGAGFEASIGTGGSSGAAGGTGGGGTGGTGGISMDGGAGAAGDSGAPNCGLDEKVCGPSCVLITDPAFGCGALGCVPCDETHATADCDTMGSCAIVACDVGWEDCNGDPSDGCEVQTEADPQHCGACNSACVTANATPGCFGGTCTISSCDPGFEDCDASIATGCERNVGADPTACGSCNNDCTANPGDWVCNSGVCETSNCPSGFRDCDLDPANGCETNIGTSPAHCGFCNNSCSVPMGAATCNSGTCEITSCNSGFDDCDLIVNNGCETNVTSNADNCGACNRACSSQGTVTRTCSASVCNPTCSAGAGNCVQPMAPAMDDGCEADLATDEGNCGSCGRGCSNTGTTAVLCETGLCTSACIAPNANCNMPVAPQVDDGCETNRNTDPDNCGACGRACATNGVMSRSCGGGICTSTCVGLLDNCSMPVAPVMDDGCEADTSADVNNCGACGRQCDSAGVATLSCTLGLCDSTCSGLLANCAQPSAPAVDDGCEADVADDPSNCGGCGRACSPGLVQTLSCSGGLCDSTCQPGRANCTQPVFPLADDGCETGSDGDPNNCGVCGHMCSSNNASTTGCSSGVCTPTCTGTFDDCSTPAPPAVDDGCEKDVSSDVFNCGACGRACAPNSVGSKECTGGLCTSTCNVAFMSCTIPAAPAADDGCELVSNSDSNNCGGCGNDCTTVGLRCNPGSTNLRRCGCTQNSHCTTAFGGIGSCNNNFCECPQIGPDACNPGEVCDDCGITCNRCSCNGGAPCPGNNDTCCQSPAGCFDLDTDRDHCGGCGRQCPPGFACVNGDCECDADGDCNAGTPGTCLGSGFCRCDQNCVRNDRCLPDGTCG